jgi:hypothetical protein
MHADIGGKYFFSSTGIGASFSHEFARINKIWPNFHQNLIWR